MYPIKGLIVTTHKPLNTIYIPNALGNFFKVQHSDMQRLRFTNVAPRKNPAITNMMIKGIFADCSANTERAVPTKRQKTQKTMRFFQPNLSKSVGNNSLARMSTKAVRDKQKATSAFVIPVDCQVPISERKKGIINLKFDSAT